MELRAQAPRCLEKSLQEKTCRTKTFVESKLFLYWWIFNICERKTCPASTCFGGVPQCHIWKYILRNQSWALAPCDAMGGSSSRPVEESRQPQNLSCKVVRVCFPESSEVYIIIMTSLVMLTSKGEIQGWDRESEKELIYKRARKMESQLVKGVEKHSFWEWDVLRRNLLVTRINGYSQLL